MLLVSSALGASLSIVGGQVWDGTHALGQANVRVVDGRVDAVGAQPAVEGDLVLDAHGATVLPGLIDSHVHLSLDPGAGWRHDNADTHLQLLRAHMRALLACGVTTAVDPAVLPAEEARIRAETVGPRYLSLGTPFSPPGGYVHIVIPEFPSVATVADVERQLDEAVARGLIGVKVTVERGFYGPVWPLHSHEIFAAIRAGAARRGLRIYAHAMSVEEQRIAVDELGATVTVHALETPDRAMIRHLHDLGVTETTTLLPTAAFAPVDLADPWLDLRVPAVELATARDPSIQRAFAERALTTMAPTMPFPRLLAHSAIPGSIARAHLRRAGRALRALADAGVPLILGSDSGNWPMIPTLFHGTSTLRELELVVEGGLTPTEALVAATSTPAALLGLDVGLVTPGRAADLVIVDGDPTVDITALRSVRWSVREGVAHTPEEWLALPPG